MVTKGEAADDGVIEVGGDRNVFRQPTVQIGGLTAMRQEEMLELINKVVAGYKGDIRVLESAIGALIIGSKLGWKPLFIINSQLTIRRYQAILGVNFRDVLPDEGPLAHKSVGYAVVKQVGRFWDSVRGTAPGRSAHAE